VTEKTEMKNAMIYDYWRSDRLTLTMKAYVLSKLCNYLPADTMLQCSIDDRLADAQLETKEYKI